VRLPTRPALLVVATVVALAGCTASGSDESGDAPEVAATVGGVDILSSRVDEVAAQQGPLLDEVPEDEQSDAQGQLERDVLSAEIQLTAVELAVEERFGLDISDEEIDTALAEQIEAQGGQEAFDGLAEEQGLTSEEAMSFAREGAYINVLIEYVQSELAAEGDVDEAELRAQYDADIASFQTSTARHILVETEAEAQDVLARLGGGEDFGALAEELSIDPGSGANGGELGTAPRGTYVGPFSDAIYSEDTALGEVVGPVETQFGFHVIIVDERTTPTFDEVRPQLEAQLTGAAFSDFLEEVFEGLEVEVDPYYGVWDPAARTVVPAVEDAPDAGATEEDAVDEG